MEGEKDKFKCAGEKDKDAKRRVGEGRDKPDKGDGKRKRKGTKGRDVVIQTSDPSRFW